MHNMVAAIQSAAEEYPSSPPPNRTFMLVAEDLYTKSKIGKKSPQTSAEYGRKLILQLLLQLTVV